MRKKQAKCRDNDDDDQETEIEFKGIAIIDSTILIIIKKNSSTLLHFSVWKERKKIARTQIINSSIHTEHNMRSSIIIIITNLFSFFSHSFSRMLLARLSGAILVAQNLRAARAQKKKCASRNEISKKFAFASFFSCFILKSFQIFPRIGGIISKVERLIGYQKGEKISLKAQVSTYEHDFSILCNT